MENYLLFLVPIGLFIWGLLCAIQDAQHRRISNRLTLGLSIIAIGYLLLTGNSFTGSSAGITLLGLALALLLSLPGYVGDKMGAGDVKMLAALALASGPVYVLGSVIIAALGMLGWVLCGPALWRTLPLALHQRIPLMNPAERARLPYAPFLFCGMLASMLWAHYSIQTA